MEIALQVRKMCRFKKVKMAVKDAAILEIHVKGQNLNFVYMHKLHTFTDLF